MSSGMTHVLGRFLAGLGIAALVVGIILLDFATGAQYLIAQAVTQGVEISWFSNISWVPIAFSVATTGFLYALWQRFNDAAEAAELGIPVKPLSPVIKVMTYYLMAADTITDIAGALTFFESDSSTAVNIAPVGVDSSGLYLDAHGVSIVLSLLIGAICLFHEPLLMMFLSRKQGSINEREDDGIGEKVEAGFVYLAGFLFNIVKMITIPISAAAMLGLDLFLGPEVGKDGMYITMLILSGLLLGLQFLLWSWYSHVSMQEDGNRSMKQVLGAEDIPKRIATFRKWAIAAIVVLILFDTTIDLCGYNTALYGSTIPGEINLAWLLNASMVVLMSGGNEALMRDIYRDCLPGKKKEKAGGPSGYAGH
jgi:hypothetical protein